MARNLRVVRPGSASLGHPVSIRDSARRAICVEPFCSSYFCGILWYIGNCYWVRNVMLQYGDMPPLAPTLLLLGYSVVLGLYFGFFGLGVVFVRKATGSTRLALAAAPVLWTALELAASRITSVPWDQLGYSQVDNSFVNQLAPWTGVYGISFVLVAVNAFIAGGLILDCRVVHRFSDRQIAGVAGAVLMAAGALGLPLRRPHLRQRRPRCWCSRTSMWPPTTSGVVPASGTVT